MTTLLFNARGGTIATASWSVGSIGNDGVDIRYLWGGDGTGQGGWDVDTGTARVRIPMAFSKFLDLLQVDGNVVDLRRFQP